MLTGDVATAADAARAALAAYEGGPAVAVVMRLDGPEAGRRLLLFETGESRGSLGSAALDAAALELARRALDGAAPGTVALGSDGDAPPGAASRDGGAAAGAAAGRGRRRAGRAAPSGDVGSAGARLYFEAHTPPETLVIVGAGHIAVPLARLGVMLGYRVIVLDDREDFATPARFPDAADVRRTDFADPFRGVPIGPRSHVLLVTRAHRYDFDCLQRLLAADPAPRYIGMIGSRRRVKAAFGALLAAGVPRDRLARVSAPVGLDIGAETPEEIAVSIAAELVAVRRRAGRERVSGEEIPGPGARKGVGGSAAEGVGGGAGARTLAEKERVLERLLREGDDG
ncbi:MAG TPA: XdhC family protein [Longimicrobiales bacterium]